MKNPHWDELMTGDSIKEASTWFERANNSGELKATAFSIWAAWYGSEIVQHAKSSMEWLMLFYETAKEKDQGGLDTLVMQLKEWIDQC